MRTLWIVLGVVAALIVVPSCTVLGSYNAFQRRDEQVSQAQTKLLSVYQKRADLVPNLVSTVKGYAKHEESVFTRVAEARAGVAVAKLPENPTPEQMEKFDQAQRELRTAMASAMRVTLESNPSLKADQGFLKLQQQLQDVETQANAARNVYIREVMAYNVNIRSFPSNIVAGVFGYKVKPQLEFDDAASLKKSPKVSF